MTTTNAVNVATADAAHSANALHTLRLRLQKKDNGRFISHLDLMRAFERTVRRLQLPVALTEGFRPHYRISFGPALPLGVSSCAEYCDLILTAQPEQSALLERISQHLPPGLNLIDGSYFESRQSLSDFITRASYQARLSIGGSGASSTGGASGVVGVGDAVDACSDLAAMEELIALGKRILESEQYIIETETRKGLKTIDLRSGIDRAQWVVSGNELICDLFLVAGSVGNLKPQDALIPFFREGATLNRLHRTGLYGLSGQDWADPFGNVLQKWPESGIEKE